MELQKKLLAIQTELKAPKNQKNSFGNYNYRSCEDILEAVKPLLDKHDCVLTITDDIVLVGDRVYVKAAAIISYAEQYTQATAFARESETKKGMDDSQITGSASSYARKYALNGLFLIDDTKDADTDEHTARTKETPKKEVKKEAIDKPRFNDKQFDDLKKSFVSGEFNEKTYESAITRIGKKYKVGTPMKEKLKDLYANKKS